MHCIIIEKKQKKKQRWPQQAPYTGKQRPMILNMWTSTSLFKVFPLSKIKQRRKQFKTNKKHLKQANKCNGTWRL